MSSVPISAKLAIASRYAVTDASVAARASALVKPLLRAAIVKLAAMRFTSYSKGPGSVSSKSLRSNSNVSLGRGIHTEVREMRVAAELDLQTRGRRVLQVGGHDLRRAAVERERGDHHPPVTDRHEIGLSRGVLLLEQRDRVGAAGAGFHPSCPTEVQLLAGGLPARHSFVDARVHDRGHGEAPLPCAMAALTTSRRSVRMRWTAPRAPPMEKCAGTWGSTAGRERALPAGFARP